MVIPPSDSSPVVHIRITHVLAIGQSLFRDRWPLAGSYFEFEELSRHLFGSGPNRVSLPGFNSSLSLGGIGSFEGRFFRPTYSLDSVRFSYP
jgi:hypothetical protein